METNIWGKLSSNALGHPARRKGASTISSATSRPLSGERIKWRCRLPLHARCSRLSGSYFTTMSLTATTLLILLRLTNSRSSQYIPHIVRSIYLWWRKTPSTNWLTLYAALDARLRSSTRRGNYFIITLLRRSIKLVAETCYAPNAQRCPLVNFR